MVHVYTDKYTVAYLKAQQLTNKNRNDATEKKKETKYENTFFRKRHRLF